MATIRTTTAFLGPFPSDAHQVWEGVPDDVAADIVRHGNAVYIDDMGEALAVEDPLAKLAQDYAPVLEAGPEASAEPDTGLFRREADANIETELKRPWGNASKAAWIEWARHVDPELTEEAAKGMSKNDLQSAYGERL